MAVTQQEVVLTFNAETGEILSATNKLSDNLNEAAKSAEDMDEAIDGSAQSAKDLAKETAKAEKATGKLGKGFRKAGSLGKSAMTKVGSAVKASGIGLLLGLLAGVSSSFTENKERAEKFEVVMSQLRIVFSVIADGVANLASGLVKMFTDSEYAVKVFRGALDGISNWFGAVWTKATAGFRKSLKRLGISFYETLETMSFGTADFSEEIAGLQQEIADINKEVEEADKIMSGSFFAPSNMKAYIDSMKAYQDAQAKITKRMQELRDAQRELDVQTAQSGAEIEKLKKIRDDERLSFEERIDAAERAQVIEQALVDEQVRIARENIAVLEDQIALQGDTVENLELLRDARVAEAEAMAASAGVQTELMTSIYGITQAQLDQEQSIADMRRGWTTENLEGIEAEKAAIEDQYNAEIAGINRLILAEEEKQKLRLEAKEARDKRVEKAEKDHQQAITDAQEEGEAEREKQQKEALEKQLAMIAEAQKEVRDLAIQMVADLSEAFLGATIKSQKELTALQDSLAQERFELSMREWELNEGLIHAESDAERQAIEESLVNERNASNQRIYQLELEEYRKKQEIDKASKREFEVQKAVSIAQASIAQAESAVKAYNSMVGIPVVGPGLAVTASIAAIAAGAAQIKSIRAQQFQGSAGTPPIPPQTQTLGGAGGAGGVGEAPTLDLSFLGEGAGQDEPIQAYVIAQDVSNAQQANQQIQDQATL